MSRRIPPPSQPPQPPATTDPASLSQPLGSLQCQTCNTIWPYQTTLPGPGGNIGILFQLEFLGCPVCKTPQPYGFVKPAAVP